MPLVERMLVETLPVAPLKFDKAEVAVVLGAACHAERLWPSSRPKPAPSAQSAPMVESKITGEAEEEARRRREAEARTAEERGRREEEEDEHRRRAVEVPNLSGQNVFQASGTLANSGLTLGA